MSLSALFCVFDKRKRPHHSNVLHRDVKIVIISKSGSNCDRWQANNPRVVKVHKTFSRMELRRFVCSLCILVPMSEAPPSLPAQRRPTAVAFRRWRRSEITLRRSGNKKLKRDLWSRVWDSKWFIIAFMWLLSWNMRRLKRESSLRVDKGFTKQQCTWNKKDQGTLVFWHIRYGRCYLSPLASQLVRTVLSSWIKVGSSLGKKSQT